MSHWGKIVASNVIIIFIYKYKINNNYTSYKEVINYNQEWPFKDTRIIEIIYGSLLGNGYVYKKHNNKGTKIIFYIENSHNDYLLYFHSLIANLGYCNTNLPKIKTKLGNKGKIIKYIKFSTWTYYQFNNIYDSWYFNNIKILPNNLNIYLTPLALSIWIMNNSYKFNSGLNLSANYFTFKENKYLIYLLKSLYNIDAIIHKTGYNNQYYIYIPSKSMPILANLIKPYLIPSMFYKLY